MAVAVEAAATPATAATAATATARMLVTMATERTKTQKGVGRGALRLTRRLRTSAVRGS